MNYWTLSLFGAIATILKKTVFEPKYIQIHEEEEAQSEECLMTEFDHQQHANTSLVIFQFDLSVLGF